MARLPQPRREEEDHEAQRTDHREQPAEADRLMLCRADRLVMRQQPARRARPAPCAAGDEQDHRAHGDHLEQRARHHAARKEAERGPEPDAAIVEAVMRTSLHRQHLRQRHHGGQKCRRQHGGDEDRPEAAHDMQQRIGEEGADGAGDDHRAAALGEVRHQGAERNGDDAHRHHHGDHQRPPGNPAGPCPSATAAGTAAGCRCRGTARH